MTFPLLETIIGFAVIMLTLSYLVKSLTSVVKNHIDYYSENLKGEVIRFLVGTLGKSPQQTGTKGIGGIKWERLSEEFLTEKNMVWWLGQLGMSPKEIEDRREALEARLAVHRANLQYAFSRRSANIALGMGLALCLFLNINAFTIWDTLYRDQEVRAKFASPESVQAAMDLVEKKEAELKELEEAQPSSAPGGAAEEVKATQTAADKKKTLEDEEAAAEQKKKLEEQTAQLVADIAHFRGEVSFGIGRVWTETPPEGQRWRFLGFEFLGSLLTGILVSIGAPYWHDLLRALTRLRGGKEPAQGGG